MSDLLSHKLKWFRNIDDCPMCDSFRQEVYFPDEHYGEGEGDVDDMDELICTRACFEICSQKAGELDQMAEESFEVSNTSAEMSARFRLEAAAAEVRFAESKLEETVRDLFPVGAKISWARGNNVHSGHVLEHWYRGDLLASNELTRNDVKVAWYQILQAMQMHWAPTPQGRTAVADVSAPRPERSGESRDSVRIDR